MGVELIALEARISESTPRDLRGVRALAGELTQRLDPAATVEIHGREEPFGATPWQDDLEASRDVLARAARALGGALDRDGRPLLLASDCSLALATLPAVAARVPDARVLWLDAHTDYDTPATTTIGFLGCMSLAGACGEWESGLGGLAAGRVVHYGGRGGPGDFDEAGRRAAEASELVLIPIEPDGAERVLAALGAAPVYVHLDPDVLDPSVNPVRYGRPGGLSGDALERLLAAVAGRGPVVGLELTAYHSPDEREERDRLTGLLARAAHVLLRGGDSGTR